MADLFSTELELPSPGFYYGIVELHRLAELAQRELGAFNFLWELEQSAELLMRVLEQRSRART